MNAESYVPLNTGSSTIDMVIVLVLVICIFGLFTFTVATWSKLPFFRYLAAFVAMFCGAGIWLAANSETSDSDVMTQRDVEQHFGVEFSQYPDEIRLATGDFGQKIVVNMRRAHVIYPQVIIEKTPDGIAILVPGEDKEDVQTYVYLDPLNRSSSDYKAPGNSLDA